MSMTMKSLYLTLYNSLNAALWGRILVSTLTTSTSSLYPSIEPWARGTQSLAIAEILHAALGTYYSLPKNTSYRKNKINNM